MEHPRTTHKPSLLGHLVLLIVALAVLAGLYLLFHSLTSLTLDSTVLILVHLSVASGLLYWVGNSMIKVIKRLHKPPAAPFRSGLCQSSQL